jgi:hypothetical protein
MDDSFNYLRDLEMDGNGAVTASMNGSHADQFEKAFISIAPSGAVNIVLQCDPPSAMQLHAKEKYQYFTNEAIGAPTSKEVLDWMHSVANEGDIIVKSNGKEQIDVAYATFLQDRLAGAAACRQLWHAVSPSMPSMISFVHSQNSVLPSWKVGRTTRRHAIRIAEVTRRVYRLDPGVTASFKQNISAVTKYRDMAVHPSLELKRSCTRPDLPVGVDWKFSAYRYSNAESSFRTSMEMLIYLYERKCHVPEVVAEMERVFAALEELRVVKRNIPA